MCSRYLSLNLKSNSSSFDKSYIQKRQLDDNSSYSISFIEHFTFLDDFNRTWIIIILYYIILYLNTYYFKSINFWWHCKFQNKKPTIRYMVVKILSKIKGKLSIISLKTEENFLLILRSGDLILNALLLYVGLAYSLFIFDCGCFDTLLIIFVVCILLLLLLLLLLLFFLLLHFFDWILYFFLVILFSKW